MLKHYLKTSIRNLWRFRGYTAINIAGLAIGMATCILIFGYISQELSYDKFHDDYKNLYRISVKGRLAEDNLDVAVSMPPLANKIKTDYPEVKAVTRIEKFEDELFFSYNDRNYYEAGLYYADSTFFDVFTFEMIRGNPQKALVEPHSLVITESIAKKYFGDEDPMGKVLRLNDESDMLITGIIRDIPDNTHLKFTMLASFTTLIQEAGKERYDQNWGSMFLHTYVRLNDNIDFPGLKKKLSLVVKEAFGEAAEGMNIEIIPYLQPVTRIHLHSHLLAEIEPNSDISYVYIFASVAVFILFIACINFMNLSTARSSKRSREVAMRKVCGATRGQLIRQFIGESVLLSLAGMLLALILVELARDFTGPVQRGPAILLLLALVLVVGFAAGSYPAFILSSFQPIRIIRKDYYRGFKKSVLRNILVVVQFTISITLLISTWLVYEQLSYIRNKNLGFDQENVVIVPLRGDRLKEKSDILRKEFAALPFIEAVSTSSSVPGKMMDGTGYCPEGIDKNSPWIIYNMRADYDCMDVFGFKLVEGRGFLRESGTDSSAVIINEALVKKLGWDEPVGKKIFQFGQEKKVAYTVIGVIKDYHFKSLHEPVEPIVHLFHDSCGLYCLPGIVRTGILFS